MMTDKELLQILIEKNITIEAIFNEILPLLKSSKEIEEMRCRVNSFFVEYINSVKNSELRTQLSDTVTDIDGNVYQTVIIGNKEWMVENLKVTRYRNGEQIPHVTDNSTWTITASGAYCVYNNTPANAATYGNLYNWYAVTDTRGLAPEGWRVPSDDDIKELEMYLGMSQAEADIMGCRCSNQGSQLAGSAVLWRNGALKNDSQFGTSGFSFLPGGYRSYYSGFFYGMSNYGYCWSSTEYNSNYTRGRILDYDNPQAYRVDANKRTGFSVRCVKDISIKEY